MPTRYPEAAGKPYRPSNGTEGEMFMEQFCNRCGHDEAYQNGTGDSCEIVANTLFYALNDPKYPKEWKRDSNGEPTCTQFKPTARTGRG